MSKFIIPVEHELWLKTNGKEGKQLDLTNSDFSEKDFTSSIIIDVIFDGANLNNIDLTYSNIRHSSFKEANIKNAIIIKIEDEFQYWLFDMDDDVTDIVNNTEDVILK